MKTLSAKFRAAVAGAVLGGAALVAAAAPAAASNAGEPAKDVSARAAFAEVICQDTYRNGYYMGRQCQEVYRQPQVDPGVQMFGLIIGEIARQQQMERYREHHRHYVPRYEPPRHYPHHPHRGF